MLSAGAFAVEAAYMIEEGYALPAMLATGLPETVASAMWAVGPLLGLFFQGYLGSASDRCTCAWGKRRPFILFLAACACLAIFLFPYGPFLSGSVLQLGERSGAVFVMVFTAFTFVAMDFFLDALQSPMRAYLTDAVPAERSERANYTYTALLCAGAMAGSLIGGVPWSSLLARAQTQPGEEGKPRGSEPTSPQNSRGQLEIVYGIATAVFVCCMFLCLNSIREKNPSLRESPRVEKYASFNPASQSADPEAGNNFGRRHNSYTSLSTLTSVQIVSKDDLNNFQSKSQPQLKTNGLVRTLSPLPIRVSPLHTVVAGAKPKTQRNGCFSRFAGDVYEDICSTILFSKYVSPHFSRLCLMVFFSWAAFLSMILYFTSFMGQVVYGGSPYSSSGEPERALFDHGVRIGFLLMLFQDFVSAVSSICMKWLSDFFGIRVLLVSVLAGYTVVCLLTASCPSLLNAVLLQLAAGLMYTNMQSLPYTLLSQYEVCIITCTKNLSELLCSKSIWLYLSHIKKLP